MKHPPKFPPLPLPNELVELKSLIEKAPFSPMDLTRLRVFLKGMVSGSDDKKIIIMLAQYVLKRGIEEHQIRGN